MTSHSQVYQVHAIQATNKYGCYYALVSYVRSNALPTFVRSTRRWFTIMPVSRKSRTWQRHFVCLQDVEVFDANEILELLDAAAITIVATIAQAIIVAAIVHDVFRSFDSAVSERSSSSCCVIRCHFMMIPPSSFML